MSVSEKVRELARDGVSIADIARRLGIRYQHAYNVLKADLARAVSPEAALATRENRADGVAAGRRVSAPYAMGDDSLVVEGYGFKHVTDLDPDRMMDRAVRAFTPRGEYANKNALPLNKYGEGPFCKFTIPRNYQNGGVYLLVVGSDIRYVGECTNLSGRFNNGHGNISPRNCYKGGQDTNCRINNLIYMSCFANETVSLFFHETTDYKNVEAQLRAVLRASWNRV